MPSTKNPFPGMNPFLELSWPAVHTKLISAIDDEISARLPEDLLSRPEERLEIDEVPAHGWRADVAVTEPWQGGAAPAWQMPAGNGVAVAEPQIIRLQDETERWIEIRTVDGRLVTVIELLSPANKDTGLARYKSKQADYLAGDVNLVEIDLLRGGDFALAFPRKQARTPDGTCYLISVRRAARPGTREVYVCPLRERLPAIRIPLRPADADLVLDLQPLIDRCYELGRYYKGRFDGCPGPAFPADEAAWIDERLRGAGLRA